jgi:RHS repeat-associated protein
MTTALWPPAFVPDWAASASSSIGGSASGLGGNIPSMTSEGMVRYADGTVVLTQTDLWSDGYGIGWGQARSWTNGTGYAPRNVNGNGVVNTQQPFLLLNTTGTTIAVVRDGTRADYFDFGGSVWTERFFGQDKLTYNSGSNEYVLTDTLGNVTKFHGFSTSLPADQRGGLKSFTDAAGNAISVNYTAGGAVSEVTRAATVGATTVTESLAYTHLSSPNANAGLVATATLRRKVDAGSWATVRSAEYAYYDGAEAHGNRGDLKTVVIKDAAGATIDTSYYRYYTAGESGGYEHGLKFLLGGAAFARMTDDLGTNLASITNTQLAPYADLYFEYNSARRVTREIVAGAGSTIGSAGQGEYTFTYTASTNTAGTNSWATKTVETLPDGNTNTVYTNAYGQVMLAVYKDTTTTQEWSTFYRYDSAGRTVRIAAPSAVSGYSDTYADLMNYSGGVAQYLRDSDGLITVYNYAASTTATTSTAGDATGYLKQVEITHGETGTAIPQETLSYIKRTAGGVDFFFTASDTVYRNDNGTGVQTTGYAYTWQGSTARPESITVTLPTVTTAQNGPNSATSAITVYDAYGRPVWSKDQAGFITYVEFDTPTGAVTKTITDVDTTLVTGEPSGWSTPSGGGLHLVATYEVDSLGRVTKVTSPEGRIDYTVYKDAAHEVRFYAGWNTSTNTPTGPTTVVRDDRANGYTETLTMSAAPSVTEGRPTGTESISSLQSLSRSYRNEASQTTHSDAYFNLSGLTYSTSTSLGTSGTHFYRTEYAYDTRGRPSRTKSAEGTIYRTVFDTLSRASSEWVGTDDTPTSGNWSPTNTAGTNLVKTHEYEYDGGGIGDSNLTKVTAIPGGGAANRVTQTWFDWRNRAVAVKAGVEGSESTSVNRPLTYFDYNNLGQVTRTRLYDADTVTPTVSGGVPQPLSSSLLRAQDETEYDELGRAFQARHYSVNPSSGAVSTNSLRTDVWYDARGLVIKESMPNGLVAKYAYDGAGRTKETFLGDWGGDSGYADADDVTGDTVVEQSKTEFDKDGNVIATVTRVRFHDASGTGVLGSPSSGIGARVSYAGYYYDAGGRLTAGVDVGTNGGSAWTRPGSVPSRSDTELVVSYEYDAAGRLKDVTDPKGLVSRTEYDALGRTTKTIENYVNGAVSDADDKTTTFAYNSVGMKTLTAHLTDGGVQTTEWVYGMTQAGGNKLDSNDISTATRWPDPSTGSASSSQQETATVNALGQVLTGTDRNTTTHALTYDVLGRVVADTVTTFGGGVDQAVVKIETAYDTLGNASLVTSRDASNAVVNQVAREFNGLGQLTFEWQSHAGAVGVGTPKAQYAYNFNGSGTVNQSRLTSVTYPSGYALTANYSSGLNSAISRVSSLSDSTGTLEGYDYLGLGAVVRRSHPQPGVDLTWIKQSGESNGDAGDQYTGLDRFGRVVDQRWIKTSGPTTTDRFQYGYDRDSNRTNRDNLVNSSFDEDYTYDGLNQLASFARGSHTQSWDYDALGNWDSVTTDGTAQNRTANKQNEVTFLSSGTTPGYDANGNVTQADTGLRMVYDAWNRLVAVKDAAGTTTLKTYAYDGLGRRVSETVGSTTTDLYYSAAWQVLEEKVGANTAERYVWSPVYVDAMVLRDRDTDGNGTLDERVWVQQDANFNVTALVDGSGVVQERYAYDPFGAQTVLDANWSADADGLSDVSFDQGFQGFSRDELTGWSEADLRWYSATLGTWTSLDPIRYAGGDVNLYRMEGNGPTGRLDPLGLQDPKTHPWGYDCRTGRPLGPGGRPLGDSFPMPNLASLPPLPKSQELPPRTLESALELLDKKKPTPLSVDCIPYSKGPTSSTPSSTIPPSPLSLFREYREWTARNRAQLGPWANDPMFGKPGSPAPKGTPWWGWWLHIAESGSQMPSMGTVRVPAAPIKSGEVTTYQDFAKRSLPGDKLAGHELWQHANLKAKGLATERLSTAASKNNPVIALDQAAHAKVNAAQRALNAAEMTPLENIKANAAILRKLNAAPEKTIKQLEEAAIRHAKSLGY